MLNPTMKSTSSENDTDAQNSSASPVNSQTSSPTPSPPISPSESMCSPSHSCHSLSEEEDFDYDSQNSSQSPPQSENNLSISEQSDQVLSDVQTQRLLSKTNSTKKRLHARLPSRRKPATQRYKLIHEGDTQLCRLNHRRTLISKIMNSRYLRRWESHHIYLGEGLIESSTVRITLTVTNGLTGL